MSSAGWRESFPSAVIANSLATLKTLRLKSYRNAHAVPSGLAVPPRFHVVHDGMHHADVVSDVIENPNPTLIVGLVGQITQWKGQHIFIDAATIVRKEFPQARFQIIGAPSSAKPSTKPKSAASRRFAVSTTSSNSPAIATTCPPSSPKWISSSTPRSPASLSARSLSKAWPRANPSSPPAVGGFPKSSSTASPACSSPWATP